MLGLILAGASIYMYFTNHFALSSTLAIAGSGLFFFSYALIVLLRVSKHNSPKTDNTFSPTSSYTPPNY